MNKNFYLSFDEAEFWADFSYVDFPEDYFASMRVPIINAFVAMKDLEKGVIANPDENRMVGHYWLRNPDLAPNEESLRIQSEAFCFKLKNWQVKFIPDCYELTLVTFPIS